MNNGTLTGGFAAGYSLNASRLDDFAAPSEARMRKGVALGIYPNYIIDQNPIGGRERTNEVIAFGPNIYPMSQSFFTSAAAAPMLAMAGYAQPQGKGTSDPYVCSDDTDVEVKNAGAMVCQDPKTRRCFKMHNNRCGKSPVDGSQLMAVNQFTGQTTAQPTATAVGYWFGQ
jgi:hypothetical protein